MIRVLIRNWWLLALRGCLALLFAMVAFSLRYEIGMPLLKEMAFSALTLMFALMAIGAGVPTIFAAVWGAGREHQWWLLLLDGAVACVAGVVVLLIPGLTLLELTHLIAIWAMVVCMFELAAAARVRRHIQDEIFLATAAAGSFVFGAYLLFHGAAEVQGALLWLALYALFSGLTMLALSLRLRNLRHHPQHMVEHLA